MTPDKWPEQQRLLEILQEHAGEIAANPEVLRAHLWANEMRELFSLGATHEHIELREGLRYYDNHGFLHASHLWEEANVWGRLRDTGLATTEEYTFFTEAKLRTGEQKSIPYYVTRPVPEHIHLLDWAVQQAGVQSGSQLLRPRRKTPDPGFAYREAQGEVVATLLVASSTFSKSLQKWERVNLFVFPHDRPPTHTGIGRPSTFVVGGWDCTCSLWNLNGGGQSVWVDYKAAKGVPAPLQELLRLGTVAVNIYDTKQTRL